MTIEERKNVILDKIEEMKASGDPETMKDMKTALKTLGVTLDG
jgi:hypothetical protein